jgi:hypothetical protein
MDPLERDVMYREFVASGLVVKPEPTSDKVKRIFLLVLLTYNLDPLERDVMYREFVASGLVVKPEPTSDKVKRIFLLVLLTYFGALLHYRRFVVPPSCGLEYFVFLYLWVPPSCGP